MFDEVLAHVTTTLAETAGDASTPGTVTFALIGAGSLVLVALINGYFGTRGDRRSRRDDDRHSSLEWEAAHAENDRRDAEREAALWHARYEVLCAALWRRGFNPNKFVTGEESDDETRFR